MALEKREPLPVGRYWIDLMTPDANQLFKTWLAFHANVKVLVEDIYEVTTQGAAKSWYLFETTETTPWGMAKKLGWPSIAAPNIKSRADTVQAPEMGDPMVYWFEGGMPGAQMLESLKGAVNIALLLGLAWLLLKKR